jgi:hypothetical protein
MEFHRLIWWNRVKANLVLKDMTCIDTYKGIGPYEYTNLVKNNSISYDSGVYPRRDHNYMWKTFHSDWEKTKKIFEETLGVKIYHKNSQEEYGVCYFDIGVEYDIERVHFYCLFDRIILKMCNCPARIFDLLSGYFIVKLVGDNDLIQVMPYQNNKLN